MKSASGDSSSTSPERTKRDDTVFDVELERGGSGAGLSCGSAGGLGGLDGVPGGGLQDTANSQQAVNTITSIQQLQQYQQIVARDQRIESGVGGRHQISQDHWHHHKSYSPMSTAHASVVGGTAGAMATNAAYGVGVGYRLSDANRNAELRAKKNTPPSPLLKYLKIRVRLIYRYCIRGNL